VFTVSKEYMEEKKNTHKIIVVHPMWVSPLHKIL